MDPQFLSALTMAGLVQSWTRKTWGKSSDIIQKAFKIGAEDASSIAGLLMLLFVAYFLDWALGIFMDILVLCILVYIGFILVQKCNDSVGLELEQDGNEQLAVAAGQGDFDKLDDFFPMDD